MSRTIALTLAHALVAAGLLAAGSSGARQTQRTIALLGQPLTITNANLSTYRVVTS